MDAFTDRPFCWVFVHADAHTKNGNNLRYAGTRLKKFKANSTTTTVNAVIPSNLEINPSLVGKFSKD